MIGQMKYLHALVILMGALIIIGVGFVVFLIFRQDAPAKGNLALELPALDKPCALSVSETEISFLTDKHILIFSRKNGRLQQKISLSYP
jgi:hypothetical protein